MSKNEIGVAETVDMMPQQPGEKLTVEFEITSGGKKIARAKRNDGRKKVSSSIQTGEPLRRNPSRRLKSEILIPVP